MTRVKKDLIAKFIKFIKAKKDGEENIYHFGDNEDKLKFTHNEVTYDLLFMGIYETASKKPKEVVNFCAIELDADGNDTTTEVFFDWNELPTNVQDEILRITLNLVYVVVESWEWESDNSDSNVLKVCSSFEKAQKAMQDAFEEEKADWLKNVVDEEDEIDCAEYDSWCSILNNVNNIDYYKIEIYEKELED